MRYVILRDDDTNALTPIDCLERLYRPFLDRGLPVNLAVIPAVATDATTPEGEPEAFLGVRWSSDECPNEFALAHREGRTGAEAKRRVADCLAPPLPSPLLRLRSEERERTSEPATLPIGSNPELVHYLRDNSGYHIVQHGCHHDYFEFDRNPKEEIIRRLDHGGRLLTDAGFPKPNTFVAPHDKFSRAAYCEIQKRFPVISCGWFERRRLPMTWWPKYVAKKFRHEPHWRVGGTTLLSHPGCLLSWRRPYVSMLEEVRREISRRRLTVLVTHWWEYFHEGRPDEEFIRCLHEVAEYLAEQKEIRVVSFADVAEGKLPLI